MVRKRSSPSNPCIFIVVVVVFCTFQSLISSSISHWCNCFSLGRRTEAEGSRNHRARFASSGNRLSLTRSFLFHHILWKFDPSYTVFNSVLVFLGSVFTWIMRVRSDPKICSFCWIWDEFCLIWNENCWKRYWSGLKFCEIRSWSYNIFRFTAYASLRFITW